MSSKTTFKRVALVAVAALTLGGFSAVSASAAPQLDTLTVSSATATALPGAAATTTVTLGYLSTGTADTVTATASIVSMPAGNSVLPTFVSAPTNNTGTPSVSVAGFTISAGSAAASKAVTANFTLGLTTNTAGTYVFKLTPGSGQAAAAVTVTFTIADTATAPTAAASRVYMRSGAASTVNGNQVAGAALLDGGNNAATAKDDGSVTNAQLLTSLTAHYVTQDSATATPANVASISVTGGAATTGTTVANFAVIVGNGTAIGTSTIIGAYQCQGSVTAGCAANYDPSSSYYFNAAGYPVTATTTRGFIKYGTTVRGVTYTETVGAINYLQKTFELISDGSLGTATVTFTAGGVLLGTKTVSFTGPASKIVATAAKTVIATGTTAGVVTGIVTDAGGLPVAGVTVYSVSDTAATVAATYTQCTAVSSATGAVSCPVTGLAAGKTNITLTTNTSSTVTTGISSNAVAVRVGLGTVATVSITFNAATYNPGEVATITVAAFDSTGQAVVDGTATGVTGAFAGSILTGTVPTIAATDVTTAGVKTYTANMPATAGTITVSGTSAVTTVVITGQTAAITGGAAVEAANAAADAAADATDAANAATDAANNAMDSADAAQQAALDAGDKADAALAAVTDLATKVGAIAAQIVALQALVAKISASVAKIAKKVKA